MALIGFQELAILPILAVYGLGLYALILLIQALQLAIRGLRKYLSE